VKVVGGDRIIICFMLKIVSLMINFT